MLDSPRQSESGLTALLDSPRQAETSLTTFDSPRQAETDLSRDFDSPRQAETTIFSEDFYATATSPSYTEWVTNFRQEYRVPRPTLQYAGLDLSSLLQDVSFDTPLNGKSTCSFTLSNPATDGVVVFPSPTCPPGSGDYADLIRQHNLTREREFLFSLDFAGQPWTSCPFLPNPPVHTGKQLSWGGDDLTALLEQVPESPLEDILLGDGDSVMAHAAAKQIADAAGIQVRCNYPDYLVGELRRGTMSPLAALDALAKPMQAGRVWENGVLVYSQVDTTAPAMWRFVDRLNIDDFQVTEYPRAFNSFVLARFSPAGGQLAPPEVGNKVGSNSVSFPAVRSVAIDVIRCTQGRLDDFVFKDEAGVPVFGGPGSIPVYSGAAPVVRADFTYYPNISGGTGSFTPSYELIVRGETRKRDDSYTATAESVAHQAVYGINKASALSESTIGDQKGAELCVRAYLAECIRKVYKAALKTKYINPFVRPGHVVEVTDRDCNQSSTRWVVESVKIAWSGAIPSMELELSRGL